MMTWKLQELKLLPAKWLFIYLLYPLYVVQVSFWVLRHGEGGREDKTPQKACGTAFSNMAIITPSSLQWQHFSPGGQAHSFQELNCFVL